MTYAVASALQTAVYQALVQDAALVALVGTDIYDELPPGRIPGLYVSIGPETARDASDKTGRGAELRFTISVISAGSGFARAKEVAGAVCDLLVDAGIALSRGRLMSLDFDRASATRIDNDSGRQIDLRFLARVEDS